MKGASWAWTAVGALLVSCRPGPVELGPRPAGAPDWQPLLRLVDSAVAAGAAPGAVLAVSFDGSRLVYGSGRLGVGDGRRPGGGTLYDLASLTKVVALTPLVMQAVAEKRLALDSTVGHYLPDLSPEWRDKVTIRMLLTHTSGLPPHRRLWELTPDGDSARTILHNTPLDTLPGVRTAYSDLGIMMLGEVVEHIYNETLQTLFEARVATPLALINTRFKPPAELRSRIAPTEQDPWRGHLLTGEVHDENAAFLGGVAAHAGLFGTAEDLLRYGEWVINVSRSEGNITSGESWQVPGAIAREFLRRQELVQGSTRALGWDTPDSIALPKVTTPPGTVWHTGFTGTAIWVVPARKLVLVLLTNRVNPTRANTRHLALRRAVATWVLSKTDGTTVICAAICRDQTKPAPPN